MKTAIAFAATYKIVICCIKQATSHCGSTNDNHTTNNSPPSVYAEKLIPEFSGCMYNIRHFKEDRVFHSIQVSVTIKIYPS